MLTVFRFFFKIYKSPSYIKIKQTHDVLLKSVNFIQVIEKTLNFTIVTDITALTVISHELHFGTFFNYEEF